MADRSTSRARPAKTVAEARPATQRLDKAFVFVISQIGGKGSSERKRADEVFEHIVTPVAKDFDLDVKRSDLDPTPGQLTTQIIKGIINARVVVADLTGRNPNVFFELGVAQSFAKPLILLVKEASSLPFDVKSERTIEIGDGQVLGVSEAKEAVRQLGASMQIVLAKEYEPTNLVTEVAAARSLDALAPENPIASELSTLREMLEEVHAISRQTIRRVAPRLSGDLAALRRFTEKLVLEDRFYPRELADLITDDTSSGFDTWVQRMVELATEIEEAGMHTPKDDSSAYDEEPF